MMHQLAFMAEGNEAQTVGICSSYDTFLPQFNSLVFKPPISKATASQGKILHVDSYKWLIVYEEQLNRNGGG